MSDPDRPLPEARLPEPTSGPRVPLQRHPRGAGVPFLSILRLLREHIASFTPPLFPLALLPEFETR